MNNETQNQVPEEVVNGSVKNYLFSASILISAVIIVGAWVYTVRLGAIRGAQKAVISENMQERRGTSIEEKVLPPDGIVLPVRWNDLGAKMISVGVIDGEKFEQLYTRRDDLDKEARELLYGGNNSSLKITRENSGMILNFLWALGLGAKNDILETGSMADPRYGGAGNFASTGGWTLAEGDAMDHYSRHPFVVLTPEQQKLVERVSKNIYRPCCNNPTHFPDCNHGIAMLGLLELMASQGISQDEMYKVALRVNAYWFPDAYLTITQYLVSKGIDWDEANPKEILGANYSSASGYRQILSQVTAPAQKNGGNCRV